MCAPTVVEWGSEEQKRRYLRPLFTGEEIWCQLFSEPGSGSDFAGLSPRGRAGRRRVDRQRSEGVDHAGPPLQVGAARGPHRPRGRKHEGLTAFVVDMQAPGRRGAAAAADDRRGGVQRGVLHRRPDPRRRAAWVDPGDGWRVSLTTLMNERVSIGGAVAPKGSGPIGGARRPVASAARGAATPSPEDELMELWIRSEVGRLTNIRAGAEPQDRHARSRRARSASWPRPRSTRTSTSSASTSWVPTACSTAPTR